MINWRTRIEALALAAVLALCGIVALGAGLPTVRAEDAVRRIIIDTEPGADDASALILAARSPGI